MTLTTPLLPVTGPGLDAFDFPADQALLVVGDVHGQRAGLEAALDQLGRLPTPGKTRTLVFLGDLIDRGPDSLGCLELALSPEAAERAEADRVIHLPGNHELLLADALDVAQADPDAVAISDVVWCWLNNGGMAFLIDAYDRAGREMPKGSADALIGFSQMLPAPGHAGFVEMVRTWPSHFTMGDALCVHAGVAPKRPLADTLTLSQAAHFPETRIDTTLSDRHWAWIRDKFLGWQSGWRDDGGPEGPGRLILHGHTAPKKLRKRGPRDADDYAEMMNRMSTNARVCLDAGAAASVGVGAGLLTASGLRLIFAPA